MKAKITVNKNYTIGKIDKRIYGSFIEHLGRAVYEGIYDHEHKMSDEEGFRKDVIEFVKSIDVPVVRYPGGNFVSGYNWEDGIGDKSKRPKKLDFAWSSIETNEVGICEFQSWAKKANTEIMMAVNLGTKGIEDAKNLLEYCNFSTDTYYSNLRKQNGFIKPFNIKTWCLGNEMDGEWQIGHKTSEEYGHLALEVAKVLKCMDNEIELVVCGSSDENMSTFGKWELDVLDKTYNYVDYISLHQYYGNEDDNYYEFVGKSVCMNNFIKGVSAMCDAIKAKKHSDKTVNLSFDEWNIWYRTKDKPFNKWRTKQPLLEEKYNFEDALLIGCMLMTLQNNCDRVKIACLAQLINVIAPIMTEKDGKVWKQTIFYPYMYASVFGRGEAMNVICESEGYKTKYSDFVPYVEKSVIHNEEKREITVFMVNRSLEEDMDVTINFENFGDCQQVEHIYLYCDDLKKENTPDTESIYPLKKDISADKKTWHNIKLKKHSWNMVRYKY